MRKSIKSAVIWGDSVARGVIFDEQRGRYAIAPATAANLIGERLGIEITNRSRMGMTSSEGLGMLEKDLERGVRADVGIIEFGGNDCDFNWQAISDAPTDVHLPRTVASDYEQNMRRMIRDVKDAGMQPVLCNLTPVNAESYLRFISSAGNRSKDNILRWLGDTFQIYRYQERYSMIVTRLARECGCRLLDIRSAFLQVWDCPHMFCRDGIHPTAEGQKLISEAILAEI